MDSVKALSDVQLGEDFGAIQLCHEFVDQGEWVVVLLCDHVQLAVVNTEL